MQPVRLILIALVAAAFAVVADLVFGRPGDELAIRSANGTGETAVAGATSGGAGDGTQTATEGAQAAGARIAAPTSGRSATATTTTLRVQALWPEERAAADVMIYLARGERFRPHTPFARQLTDEGGTAVFLDVEPGTVRLESDRGDSQKFEIEPGTEDVTFTLKGGFSVQGTVLGPDDAPVGGAQIWLQTAKTRWTGGRSIEGIVRYADGYPIPGLFITLADEHGDQEDVIVSDQQGVFRFLCLEDTTYEIRVQLWDAPKSEPPLRARGVIPDRGRTELSVSYDKPKKEKPGTIDVGVLTTVPGGFLRLRARRGMGAESLEPKLYLKREGDLRSTVVQLGRRREVLVDNLTPGDYEVSGYGRGMASLKGNAKVQAGTIAEVAIELRPGALCRIEVWWPENHAGSARRGYRFRDAREQVVHEYESSLSTMPTRPYELLRTLPPGRFRVEFWTDDGLSGELEFTVPESLGEVKKRLDLR